MKRSSWPDHDAFEKRIAALNAAYDTTAALAFGFNALIVLANVVALSVGLIGGWVTPAWLGIEALVTVFAWLASRVYLNRLSKKMMAQIDEVAPKPKGMG